MPKITIEAARRNVGLTQKKAAEQLGISYQTLSKYERNPKSLSIEMLEKMSKVYHMPMIDFIFK